MSNPIRTLADTIGWEHARLGKSRLTANDWAAGPDIDDCALFQSVAVFGAQRAWNVDAFKSLDGGTYHAGKAGLNRGDVVLFDWDGNGVGNHTELALSAPDGAGNFTTIGANGGDTIAVAERTRNGYVLGYFRPHYIAAPATSSSTTKGTEEMLYWIKGKAGARRGGLYRVVGNSASFVTGSGKCPVGVPQLIDEDQIKALQGQISGLA
jgi:hypothetical protein